MNTDRIKIFASADTWIEGEAVRQLERVASMNGMKKVAGLPDLHPGKGSPIGAAMLSEGIIYPYLIGPDIGCGMALFETEMLVSKAKPEKWFKKLRRMDEPWSDDAKKWLLEHGAQPEFIEAAGTIGHGNHFAELMRIQEIHDSETFEKLNLAKDRVFLLVHSGSRGLGDMILRDHSDKFRDSGLEAGSADAVEYLARHDNALIWARANRHLIAHRLLEQLDSGYRILLDLCHNSISAISSNLLLHRKGAAPSDQDIAVIPGSRGTYSYLVKPMGSQEDNLLSIPHGAGRKWKRSDCRDRLRDRFKVESLCRTKLGSFVICEDREVLYEEAPQAYKDIDKVIHDMVDIGLIEVVASFRPLLTYKGREM
jgi:release factor H-coupled RctB family protein